MIFVDWPPYSAASNGVRCLYELAVLLNRAGHDVYGVPRNMNTYFRGQIDLPVSYREIPVAMHLFGSVGDFYIVAETAPPKMVAAARKRGITVIWWQLAPYRFLGSNNMPRAGDFSLPYSSYVDPDASSYYYYQPPLDHAWRQALAGFSPSSQADESGIRLCVYNGKGRIRALPRQILDLCGRAEVVAITRESPSSRAELLGLLRSCHGLISFDEFSALNLEAASMGVPVFIANPLFPAVCRSRFSVEKLREYVTEVPSEFEDFVGLRMRNALPPWAESDLMSSNEVTLRGWNALLLDASLFRHFQVEESSIERYAHYTHYLDAKRVISVCNGGQSGGVLFLPIFFALISRGRCPRLLLAAISLLDYAYVVFGFLFVRVRGVCTRVKCKIYGNPPRRSCYSYRRGLRSVLSLNA